MITAPTAFSRVPSQAFSVRSPRSRCVALLLLIVSAVAANCAAQVIDAVVTPQDRKPFTIADQISDPAERAAFLSLSNRASPSDLLAAAKSFLASYPQSAYLTKAYEAAARASFDLGNYTNGLEYAKQSLHLLPENPLFLVAVADVQAYQHQNDAAIATARDALEYLDLFARPASISAADWPAAKRKLQASANFAIGRAQLAEALDAPVGETRSGFLGQSESNLVRANQSNPADSEIEYTLGLVRASAGETAQAATDFAAVYREAGNFAPQALDRLHEIYNTQHPSVGFDAFLAQAEEAGSASMNLPATVAGEPTQPLFDYAGSDSCKTCHGAVYRQWLDSGMEKMFRAYAPQNVIGDFARNNSFSLGDDPVYRDGKLEIVPGKDRIPFARMVLRSGRHYIEIRQTDGTFRTYPVDYTIGSKWQQGYATKLPNGEIHVLPVQYNVIYKTWLNYWKVIDDPGSERSDPRTWETLDNSTNYMTNCAVCHTSQVRNTKPGTLDSTSLVFREPGINCEMCHGPSARHVAAMEDGVPYDKGPYDPPVQFGQVSNRQFVAVCAQCHMQSAIREFGPQGEMNYSRVGNFFLSYERTPYIEFSRKAFFKDGRFRQTTFMVEALERTQCFRKGGVTCSTCHDPHAHDESSNLTSLKFPNDPDKMCTGCHTKFQDPALALAHTHHKADSEGSRCVSCHMPRIMDALAFRARTHQIDDIPNSDMTLRFGQSDSPNACLLCHVEKDPIWVENQLAAWKTAP
jgi:predicted CXXCH cytochrome family protein